MVPGRFIDLLILPAPNHFCVLRLPSYFLLFTLVTLLPFSSVLAEVRIVSAQGEFRMGDRDTKEDAVRLAAEAAKRNALEQVAIYLESITVVEGEEITRDEIRTYTAGLVLVLDQQANLMLDGDSVVVMVDLRVQVDTDEVARAIVALRENEDARHQLVALREEIDTLHKELESSNEALAMASTAEEAQQANQYRQDLLDRVQSNAMVAQAWTNWVVVAPVMYPYPWVGVAQATGLLNVARHLYPNSPYVQTAQREIIAKQPPLPLQPPVGTVQTPTQQPASGPTPVPLNEVSYAVGMQAPHIGNRTGGLHEGTAASPNSRTLTDIRQLNPLLPAPSRRPPAIQQFPSDSRSAGALHRFLQSPQAAASPREPQMSRRIPPAMNQIRPTVPHQAPRVPRQIAPGGFGGGRHHGGGGGYGTGRGGGHGGGGGRGSVGGRGR